MITNGSGKEALGRKQDVTEYGGNLWTAVKCWGGMAILEAKARMWKMRRWSVGLLERALHTSTIFYLNW